jgi:hypothetical protein
MSPSYVRSISNVQPSSKSGLYGSFLKVRLDSSELGSVDHRADKLDLRISIREKGVFACFHPDAGDLFNVCSDLKRVCWTLYDPKKRLEKNVSRPTAQDGKGGRC